MATNIGYTVFLKFRITSIWKQLGIVTHSQSHDLRSTLCQGRKRGSHGVRDRRR
jgi:hypothetical protein